MLFRMPQSQTLDQLHASLNGRLRPEDVADLILTGFGEGFDGRERALLDRAARHAARRQAWRWSSMSEDFARPVDASRQLAVLAALFHRDPGDLACAVTDPDALRLIAAGAAEAVHWWPGADFKADRLTRTGRAVRGIELSKRQYNRAWRFLARFAAKVEKLDVELQKRHLMLVGRSGLAADISLDRFQLDPAAACFVAYFVARRNLRRQFSLSGRDNPYDEIADMLYRRCARQGDTDWWMMSRAYPTTNVLARLSQTELGELLGRWSALMRGAAGILERSWDPQVNRQTMIVRRGMDSSTWNTIARAYNTARAGWLNTLSAAGAEQLLDVACPGKAMRLMAADLAYWHRSSGSDVDPDTAVWAALPLPWEVLSGDAACTRETVAAACRQYGVDPERKGWTAPRVTGSVARFKPTPELVHGVSIADPLWAGMLRKAGVFSGKKIRAEYAEELAGGIPDGVVTSDLPTKAVPG